MDPGDHNFSHYFDGAEMNEPNWLQAACRGTDMEIWFSPESQDFMLAQEICAPCPIQEECRQYAIDTRSEYGVWGGQRAKHLLRSENEAVP